MSEQESVMPNGPAAAAILASGIGCFVLGVITTLAAAVRPVSSALALSAPVGPLSGKTTVAVVVWLLAWLVLGLLWKDRSVAFGRVFVWTLVLIALGLIGTFPVFYEAFGG